MQDLSESFRVNYARLWLSIMRGDINGIREHSTAMGVGNLYGLFACMVAARSWKSITTKKVDSSAPDAQEVRQRA